MKKALIVLLILAVAGGLFAQSFSGSVTTGAMFTFDGEDNPVAANDDDGHAVKSRLSFTNGGDDWGFEVGANADVNTDGTVTTHYVDALNGWVKFADIFKLTAGKGIGGNWQATTSLYDSGPGGSLAGARLNVTPIDGLDLGLVFGYPNESVAAGKIGNFFQETAIGAKYDAGIFAVGTALKLFSEETTGDGMDATWWLDAQVPLSFFTINLELHIQNLTEKKDAMNKYAGVKLEGDVAALSWSVSAEALINDPTTATAGAWVEYGIPISDKATVSVGADASLTILEDFAFDTWDIYAKLGYDFNANVSTWFKFKIDGVVDTSDITPSLQWNIGYSF